MIEPVQTLHEQVEFYQYIFLPCEVLSKITGVVKRILSSLTDLLSRCFYGQPAPVTKYFYKEMPDVNKVFLRSQEKEQPWMEFSKTRAHLNGDTIPDDEFRPMIHEILKTKSIDELSVDRLPLAAKLQASGLKTSSAIEIDPNKKDPMTKGLLDVIIHIFAKRVSNPHTAKVLEKAILISVLGDYLIEERTEELTEHKKAVIEKYETLFQAVFDIDVLKASYPDPYGHLASAVEELKKKKSQGLFEALWGNFAGPSKKKEVALDPIAVPAEALLDHLPAKKGALSALPLKKSLIFTQPKESSYVN